MERVKDALLIKPIVYGNTAFVNKEGQQPGHTHKWKLYVRPGLDEDMSIYVDRIEFTLHETYKNNVRVVDRPPYEVNETGWGEFETIITIHFRDPCEPPVTFSYFLRLFSTDSAVVLNLSENVNEIYDELVFRQPTLVLYELLLKCKDAEIKPEYKNYIIKQNECLKSMNNARELVDVEVKALKERLALCHSNIKALVAKLENETDIVNAKKTAKHSND